MIISQALHPLKGGDEELMLNFLCVLAINLLQLFTDKTLNICASMIQLSTTYKCILWLVTKSIDNQSIH